MGRRDAKVWIAVALFVAFVLLLHVLVLGTSDYSAGFSQNPSRQIGHVFLTSVPHFLAGAAKTPHNNHLFPDKNIQQPNSKTNDTKLSVFKGREAKMNHAIFNILAIGGPQTIYDSHKQIKKCRKLKRTHYPNVNKRMRALEQTGYLKIIDVLDSKAGSKKAVYDMTPKAYLAIKLDSISKEDILNRSEENVALQILVALTEISPQDQPGDMSVF